VINVADTPAQRRYREVVGTVALFSARA